MKFKQVVYTTREDWLKWRHQGIGSSDAPVIMGVSRFKTYDQLLAEKSGPVPAEDPANAYIKDRGNRIEQVVRKLYSDYMGLDFQPMSCQNIDTPWMLSTLDGVDKGLNLMIEVKLLSSQSYENFNPETPGYIKWCEAASVGKVPEDYYPQIQHQLMTTGIPACVFIGLKELRGGPAPTMDDLAMVTVLPDPGYITDLRTRELAFMNQIRRQDGKENTDPDRTGPEHKPKRSKNAKPRRGNTELPGNLAGDRPTEPSPRRR